MGKTRRRVSSKKTRKALKVRRGGDHDNSSFQDALQQWVLHRNAKKKEKFKKQVVHEFKELSESDKKTILAELGIKSIGQFEKASWDDVYGLMKMH